jgi:thioesterase domain-containing protein
MACRRWVWRQTSNPSPVLKAMAEHYVAAVRTVQPDGPYLLGGWSFGVHIAYEMAQVLHRAGQRVALLALIDTPPATALGLGDLLRFSVTTALPAIWPYVFDYFRLFAGEKDDHYAAHPSWLPNWPGMANGRSALQSVLRQLPEAIRVLRVLRANTQAQFHYAPRPYPGRLTLFRTNHAHGESGKWPDLGWRALAPDGVEIYRVPGHHLNLLRRPYVRVLAEQLRRCLLAAIR